MTSIEIAVGYVFMWAVRKAGRAAGRTDTEVDRTLDASMDRLHDLVSRKLGQDPAWRRLTEEAGNGREQPSDRTRRRVQLALEDAAETDPSFAERLARLIEQLAGAHSATDAVTAGADGQTAGGSVTIRADNGGIAAWSLGDVHLGILPPPGPPQG
jgi:hypothetical protein